MKQNFTYLISLLVVFFIGAGLSYVVTPSKAPKKLESPYAGEVTPAAGKFLVDINPSEPRDQACPLNGLSYTKTEKNLWEKQRPMAIMIENHLDARPQSGINEADIVYESVAEGGITRFMAVFYCDSSAQDLIVGPVRSARTYFLDWASEYGKYPLYVHVGGGNTPNKANALGQIKDYGWYGGNDLNQFGLSIKECWRDYNRLGHQAATEHTMYCSTSKLLDVANKRGYTSNDPKGDSWLKYFTPWKFGATPDGGTGKPATNISFDFWKDFFQYTVKWDYDSASKTYLRSTGGSAHIDRDTNKQLATGTIILQFVTETGPIDEEKHMLYGTIGSGNAIIFSQGQAFTATWSKKSRLDRTIFKDAKGKDFQFVPGKIWVEILSKTNDTVKYQ